MSNVKRVYVEKKPEFAVAAKGLRHEIRHYLGLQDVTNVRVLIRYDAENISEETFDCALLSLESQLKKLQSNPFKARLVRLPVIDRRVFRSALMNPISVVLL